MSIDTTKLTNKELADELIKPTTLEIYKIEASNRLRIMPSIPNVDKKQIEIIEKEYEKVLAIKLGEEQKREKEITTCKHLLVACDYSLKESKTIKSPFYPNLANPIEMPENFIATSDIILTFELEEAMKITEKDLDIDNIELYTKDNPDLNNRLIYYPKLKLYANQNDKTVLEELPDLRFETLEKRQHIITEFLLKNKINVVIEDFYNPATIIIKTGKTKQFKIKLTGAVMRFNNLNIAQAILID